jgi:hypothetical protein
VLLSLGDWLKSIISFRKDRRRLCYVMYHHIASFPTRCTCHSGHMSPLSATARRPHLPLNNMYVVTTPSHSRHTGIWPAQKQRYALSTLSLLAKKSGKNMPNTFANFVSTTHVITHELLNGFSWNLTRSAFSKIWRQIPIVFKMGQKWAHCVIFVFVCEHTKILSLNIYWKEKYRQNQTRVPYSTHIPLCRLFSVRLIKHLERTRQNYYAMCTFPNLFTLIEMFWTCYSSSNSIARCPACSCQTQCTVLRTYEVQMSAMHKVLRRSFKTGYTNFSFRAVNKASLNKIAAHFSTVKTWVCAFLVLICGTVGVGTTEGRAVANLDVRMDGRALAKCIWRWPLWLLRGKTSLPLHGTVIYKFISTLHIFR